MGYDPDVFGGASGFDADVFPTSQTQRLTTKETAQPVTDFSGNLRFATPFGTIDTGLALPESVNRRLAQYGSGVADVGLGIRQRFASDKPRNLSDIVTGQTDDKRLRAEAADKRALDANLNDDLTGTALSLAGSASPLLALPVGYAGALGRGAPLVEGAIAGGLGGAVQPVAGNESVAKNITAGTVAGAALPAAFQGARALVRPAPQTADLARKAVDQYGIPLALADVSGNTLVKATRSVLNDLPLTGAIGARQDAAKQAAFNKAVGATFGAPELRLSPQVMDTAKGRIGAELDRLWNRNTVAVDPRLLDRMQLLRTEASKLPRGEGARLTSWIDDLESKIVPGPEMQATIPGDVANRLQSKLGRDASTATGFLKESLSGLRAELIGAFNRSVSAADADALSLARTQYKNLKTVEPLLDRGAVATGGRLEGDVPPELLSEAVRKAYPGLSSKSPPPIAELAQIGGRLLTERVPRTGGSPRAIVQNSAIGTGLAGLTYANPWSLLGVPAAVGLQGLLSSPKAARALLRSRPARGLLESPELFPALTEAGSLAIQRAPVPLGLLALNPATLE